MVFRRGCDHLVLYFFLLLQHLLLVIVTVIASVTGTVIVVVTVIRCDTSSEAFGSVCERHNVETRCDVDRYGRDRWYMALPAERESLSFFAL